MASAQRRKRIGILFSQFAAYHVDRCAAVTRRMAGRADVLAVEVATTSVTYAWAPSGEVPGASKIVLFPGEAYEHVGRWRRFRAQLAALRRCDVVFVGIGYDQPDVILLAAALRAAGRRVILMSESKFDDRPRHMLREMGKALLLSPFNGALVGADRHVAYMRFLGFRRRPVLTGYDAVDLARVRAQGGGIAAPDGPPHAQRPFVYVGRFVEKKNLDFLLRAYARYRDQAGEAARRLVLVGGGDLEPELRARIASLGLSSSVEVTGFVGSGEVAARLAGALALVLPSVEEQWGLVVNEALAFNLPVIVSTAVGSRDALVGNLVNGFVVEPDSLDGWGAAMTALAGDEALWRRMAEASPAFAGRGDAERFAEAVEALTG